MIMNRLSDACAIYFYASRSVNFLFFSIFLFLHNFFNLMYIFYTFDAHMIIFSSFLTEDKIRHIFESLCISFAWSMPINIDNY